MKKALLIISFIISVTVFTPVNVFALPSNSNIVETDMNILAKSSTIDMSDYNKTQNCNTLLGNPSDPNSVAWLIDKILSYTTIAGMALVVVLSSIDFLKVIANSDDDQMQKASKKLAIRLILAALLFFVPTLTNAMLGIFGLTSDSTCGIQQ